MIFSPTASFAITETGWGCPERSIEFVRKAAKLSRIREDLESGAVAVAHLDGHYVAVVDYDPATDRYLVLDSAADDARGTAPDGVRWLSEADFGGSMQLKNTDGPLQVFRLRTE